MLSFLSVVNDEEIFLIALPISFIYSSSFNDLMIIHPYPSLILIIKSIPFPTSR